jgi:hypothetical protein
MRARSYCPIPFQFKASWPKELSRWFCFRGRALAFLACWRAGQVVKMATRWGGTLRFPHRKSVLKCRTQTYSEDRLFVRPSIEINPINFNVSIFAVGIKYLCEDRKFASIRICSSSEVNLRQHNPDATSRPNAAPSKV